MSNKVDKSKEFEEMMGAGVKHFVDNHEYNKATNHITFNEVTPPEGVTEDSMVNHVDFINKLSSQVEVATGQIAREQFEHNDELTTVDSTLNWGGLNINSQHHLKQKIGGENLFGVSTTAVDYLHSEEESLWLEKQRQANIEAATKLFKD